MRTNIGLAGLIIIMMVVVIMVQPYIAAMIVNMFT